MDTNKTKFSKLESRKSIFLQTGLVIALASVFFAFEWKTPNNRGDDWDLSGYFVDVIDDDVVITRPKKPEPPPKPKTVQFKQVSDEQKTDDFDAPDVEVKQNDKMDIYIPPPPKKEKLIEAVEELPFKVVEDMPAFPGGYAQMQQFLASGIKYPQIAMESNTQGIVYLSFIVEKDGSISNVRILRGIGAGCDEEAIRVVKSMPRWTPGRQLDKPVRVEFNLPVNFRLMD